MNIYLFMRRPRLTAPEHVDHALYHCLSRVVDRRKVLGEAEKEQFVRLMRLYEKLYRVPFGTDPFSNRTPSRPERVPPHSMAHLPAQGPERTPIPGSGSRPALRFLFQAPPRLRGSPAAPLVASSPRRFGLDLRFLD